MRLSRRGGLLGILWIGAPVFVSACALSHPRPLDGGRADVPPAADVRAAERCTDRWRALAACPAEPEAAVGRPCLDEGHECGTACCQPSPALLCRRGIWSPLPEPECSDVDCADPLLCGDGYCGRGNVCLRDVMGARCVVPPVPMATCGEVPDLWLGSGRGCDACACTTGVTIDLCPSP